MLNRRQFISVLGAGAVAGMGALAGCTPDAGPADTASDGGYSGPKAANGKLDPSNPTKITFYSYNLSMPSAKDTIQGIIDGFNNGVGKEKGVQVEGAAVDVTASTSKTTTDIQAGNQVSVIQNGFATLDSDRDSIGLLAYEDVFGKDVMNEAFQGIDEGAQQLGVIGDKMYGIAFTFSTPVLYVNATLFKKAGLDPVNGLPKTWDDVAKACAALKDAMGGKPPLCLGTGNTSYWVMDSIFFSNGADVLSDDRKQAVFASNEGVEAMQMLHDLYKSGYCVQASDTEAANLFAAGGAAMHLYTTALYSLYQKGAQAAGWELTGTAEPAFGTKTPAPTNSGSCLTVRPQNDNEAAACWEFIKYATSAESYTKITENIGYLPLRAGIVDDPKYLKDFADKNPLLRVNIEQLKNIRPATIWPAPNANEELAAYVDGITKAVTTDADVEETLKATQDQINGLLG